EGASTTFVLRFSPNSYGTYSASAHIANNDPDENPYDIALGGSGLAPDIAVRHGATAILDGTGAYNFTADVYADGSGGRTSTAEVFTIENQGTTSLVISSILSTAGNTSDFLIQDLSQTTISVGSLATFSVSFDPVDTGARSATISIASNAPGAKNPYTFSVSGSSSFAPKVYWSEREQGRIMRANLDGSNIEQVTAATSPVGIAVDQVNNRIYWTEISAGWIKSANLDGSSPTVVLGTPYPFGLAIDEAIGELYYTSYDYVWIGKVSTAGTGASTYTIGVPVFGIAVDPASDSLYWSTFTGQIMTGSKTTLGAGGQILGGSYGTGGIALDLAHNFIYWVEQYAGLIRTADLANFYPITVGSASQPNCITVDPEGGWIFYAGSSGGITRTGLFGDAQIMFAGVPRIYGIAVDLIP
ncbi:MAG TPA: choice-of-anchor D domain-containing protein, partial [Spirochaetia bacterium]|nr:choice-of-anchor D domain-containing protein [Spirochaetia bacterium]